MLNRENHLEMGEIPLTALITGGYLNLDRKITTLTKWVCLEGAFFKWQSSQGNALVDQINLFHPEEIA